MDAPSSAVIPAARKAWGPVGAFAWGLFTQNDLFLCYPQPQWVADRLRLYPQRSVGNSLRDPLPVPFTADEVVVALTALPKGKRLVDRVCSRVDPAQVHIALQVLPIIEGRNGGWIDFVQGRREDPYLNRPWEPRANVFNLRCLLNQLPGKPLAAIDQAPCNWEQPRRLEALYNIADVRTTFGGVPAAAPPAGPGLPAPGPRPFGPAPDGPGSEGPLPPQLPPPTLLGLQIDGDVAAPEPFSFSLFELFETHDIKGA